MDAIAEKVIGGFSSLALQELGIVWNLKDDKTKIERTVSAIKAVLKDAETKAFNNNHQVSNWLEDLKDVLFDADDLLDDFSTEALRRRLMTGTKILRNLQIFFSKQNQIAYALKMGHKMKEIRERLDDIAETRQQLQLSDHPVEIPAVYRQRQTHSYVREDEIIGREEEKNLVEGYLLDDNATDNVSVVAIVGIGGLGKTALAQLVYNDKAVQEYFELKMWVCVSDEFDICKIAQNIVEDAGNSVVEHAQQKLRDKIRGKKYLLVLDDVWNEDGELWHHLKCLLMEGGKGSKIIVTTRSNTVAKIMSTHPPLELKGLEFERSWKLFCKVAFDDGKEPLDSELVDTGKDIVRKCGGVPLAIRSIGSLLFSRNLGLSDWQYFKDVEFSKVEQQQEKTFAVLKLSYDHLPSYLKNCFAFCSLFPKDHLFVREELIQLWIAEGFIQLSDKIRCEEDVGHEYFMFLLSRSFFQDVELDTCGEICFCKMHDLIHDLAQMVAGNEYNVLSEGKEKIIDKRTRHLSYHSPSVLNCFFSSSLTEGAKIRTLFSPFQPFRFENTIFDQPVLDFVLKLKSLRTLTLDRLDIIEIPKSIKELKHLRFLRLSNLFNLIKLPMEITSLPNLQSLWIIECSQINELPSGINKLISLKHLLVNADNFLKTGCMPHGLKKLSCLQTLMPFVLSPTNSISSLTVLGSLNNLRELLISNLNFLRGCAREVEAAKVLIEKRQLQDLQLYWSSDEPNNVEHDDEMILQGLQPHCSIKRLLIDGFSGESLPHWMGNLSSLIALELSDCKFLTSLPEGIKNLKALRSLRIYGCPMLKDWCEREKCEDWLKIVHITVHR